MSLSRDEAAQTLREMSLTERQSADLARYRHSAPFFYWWGLYWLCCYGATALWPWRAWLIWTAGSVIAVTGHILLVWKIGRRYSDWRWGAAYGIVYAFAAATIALMQLHLPLGMNLGAFTPLLAGTIYAVVGLWAGTRILVTGLVIVVSTMIGVFAVPFAFFAWWMAALGGGALLLTGYWLQKA